MDGTRFDSFARIWAAGSASRRRFLRGLAAGGLGTVLAPLSPPGADAREAAGSRRRCRTQGDDCRGGKQCCSGVCRKRRCRQAPNQGRCTIERDACRDGNEPCGRNGAALCQCRLTTAGASFCGGGGVSCAGVGFEPICDRDADCAPITGPGSKCVRQSVGVCAGGCAGDRGCQAPCPTLR